MDFAWCGPITPHPNIPKRSSSELMYLLPLSSFQTIDMCAASSGGR
jgi:hypothetical protein